MSGVRQVVRYHDIPFDPKDMLLVTSLPRALFVDEEPDAQRIVEFWGLFIQVANDLCRTRRSCFANKYLKRAAFRFGMEKICLDFSRRTENIKIEFHHTKGTDTRTTKKHHSSSSSIRRKTRYALRIVKLSDIHESVRNARPFYLPAAEIPPQGHEARAQLVVGDGSRPAATTVGSSHHQEDSAAAAVNASLSGTTRSSDHHRAPPFVPVEIVEDGLDNAANSGRSRPQDTVVHMMLEPYPYMDVPIASEVVAIAMDNDHASNPHHRDSESFESVTRGEKTVLQRMQELESIRPFLTEEEYTSKRQDILNSI